VKLGTFYFKGLVTQFGGAHFALASYNAGESRVEKWIAERGPLPQDEFIDDIPFPETQNYVKKILGTAEDYRRLYGTGAPADEAADDATPAVAHDRTPAAKKASASAAAPTTKKKAAPPPAKKKTTTRKTKKAA
jgi:soluble lytic murein transglycosylase